MKERIAKWYKMNLWTESMVHDAVEKNYISSDDFTEIIGKEYK